MESIVSPKSHPQVWKDASGNLVLYPVSENQFSQVEEALHISGYYRLMSFVIINDSIRRASSDNRVNHSTQ